MKIILPRGKFLIGDDVVRKSAPLFFLAGPTQGSRPWHERMCYALQKEVEGDFTAAIPQRWDTTHPLSAHFAQGALETFDRQLAWEQWFLRMAGNIAPIGCIIFWLGLEDEDNPRDDGNPYAMDTRREIGKWQMLQHFQKSRVVWGAEEGFPGLSQIKRDFDFEFDGAFPFHSSIEDTARAAVQQYCR